MHVDPECSRLPFVDVSREFVPDWRLDEQAMWLDTPPRLPPLSAHRVPDWR